MNYMEWAIIMVHYRQDIILRIARMLTWKSGLSSMITKSLNLIKIGTKIKIVARLPMFFFIGFKPILFSLNDLIFYIIYYFNSLIFF